MNNYSGIPLSIPAPGRTMQALVSRWESLIIDAHNELLVATRKNECENELISRYNYIFRPLIPVREFKYSPETEIRLATASIIIIWILAKINLAEIDYLSYAKAEEWFLGKNADKNKTFLFNDWIPNETISKLNEEVYDSSFRELLPYILELFELNTANPDISFPLGKEQHKRAQGLFYTPSDLADFMVAEIITKQPSNDPFHEKTWLDASCGSGVFLLSILKMARSKGVKDISNFLTDSIYGLDISPFAVNSSAFVLTNYLIQEENVQHSPWLTWQTVRGNLAIIDTTLISKQINKRQGKEDYKRNRQDAKQSILSAVNKGVFKRNIYSIDAKSFFKKGDFQIGSSLNLFDVFPEIVEGFDYFIGNPPYSAYQDAQYKHVRESIFKSIENGKEGNIYALFIEAMWNFTKEEDSIAALVVPLSISYSTSKSLKNIRTFIEKSNWSFKFSFYDRTPDSLFGDAVKTRNCVIELHKTKSEKTIIETSGFTRWNSRNRSDLFANLKFVTIPNYSIRELIPKLNSVIERDVYQALSTNSKKLGLIWKTNSYDIFDASHPKPRTIYYYNVAYNWLSSFRQIPKDAEGNLVPSSSLRGLTCSNEDEADFLFTILTSRLVYWLWRVEGDGFHVSQTFLDRLPIHPSQFSDASIKKLSDLSRNLWKSLIQNPIVSFNSGKKTINYSPQNCGLLLDQIDQEVISSLNLPVEFSFYLKNFVQENISVGRQDEFKKNKAWRKDD